MKIEIDWKIRWCFPIYSPRMALKCSEIKHPVENMCFECSSHEHVAMRKQLTAEKQEFLGLLLFNRLLPSNTAF